MSDWQDGEVRDVPGKPYKMKYIGGIYSCSCVAWRMQSKKIDERSCKHLKAAGVTQGLAPKPTTRPAGTPAPDCACHQGSACNVSHDPAVCPCEQCTGVKGRGGVLPAGESPEELIAAVMGVKVAPQAAKPQENAVPLKSDGIERDKSKRLNRFGGFVPFSDQEKAVIVAEEEARKGRKLRQDEKTDLFGPPILLAQSLEDYEDLDPAGWLESEKLDGVRAYWNGECFVSRQGNVYQAPEFFLAELPQEPLDGELWMGRKKFQQTISIVKAANSGERWNQIRFVVFDAPIFPGEFRARLAHIFQLDLGHFAFGHPHQPCDSKQGLLKRLADAAEAGAEGLMIRRADSLYEPRRSSCLLKAKPFKDAEAVVIGYEAGKKANKGKTGGLIVQMPNGKTFNVGTGLTAKDRDNPPTIGATITYRYTELTDDGKPKCASYVATRDYD